MCGYFCIGSIDFIFADKTLTDFTSLILLILLVLKITEHNKKQKEKA